MKKSEMSLPEIIKYLRKIVLKYVACRRRAWRAFAEFLALHSNDAKSMLEDRVIEAVAVKKKNDGTIENYDIVLKTIASKRQ